jgi:hypothetical protein
MKKARVQICDLKVGDVVLYDIDGIFTEESCKIISISLNNIGLFGQKENLFTLQVLNRTKDTMEATWDLNQFVYKVVGK